MGVVAIDAEKVHPLPPFEVTRSLPVYPCLPISEHIPVALAAEKIALGKIDQLAAHEAKFIPVIRVVAVETPSHVFCVVQFDVRVLVLQIPFCAVRLKPPMAVAARKNALGERRAGHGEIFAACLGEEAAADPKNEGQ
jgi:hypothetical protein